LAIVEALYLDIVHDTDTLPINFLTPNAIEFNTSFNLINFRVFFNVKVLQSATVYRVFDWQKGRMTKEKPDDMLP
jgi:hypothetical protein